jgi:hypothetical protein
MKTATDYTRRAALGLPIYGPFSRNRRRSSIPLPILILSLYTASGLITFAIIALMVSL